MEKSSVRMESNLLSPKNVMLFLHFKKADKYFALMTLGRNHYLPAVLKNNEDKMLRLTITLLHILGKNKKIRQGRGKLVTFQN